MNIKKILTSSILAVMSLSSVTVFNHVNADITANVIADVNKDGKVSSMDILLVKQNIFNIISQSYVKFDINNDGVVNVIDINIVKNLLNDNSNQPQVTNPPVTDPPQTQPPATEPPQTQPPVTDPPQTEPPVQDNNDYSGGTLIDGHGNVYPAEGYSYVGEVVFPVGNDGCECAQNYAAAVEAFYGIPMNVYGNAVEPACFSDWSVTGTLEELNAWRQGRSPAEIGPAEISSHWALIGNDIGFSYECEDYLANDLQLQRDFASGNEAF